MSGVWYGELENTFYLVPAQTMLQSTAEVRRQLRLNERKQHQKLIGDLERLVFRLGENPCDR